MSRLLAIVIFFGFFSQSVFAENSLLVGKNAPKFSSQALLNSEIVEDFSLEEFKGRYVVLFFYPLDFTFVCPTELFAFQEQLCEFEEKDAQVIGCSVDSVYAHQAWENLPKYVGGIQGVTFPLVSDIKKDIARKYQVLDEESGTAFRGLFLIDREGVIRHQTVNDISIGRSVKETLRLLDALKFVDQHGEGCPANWETGELSLKCNKDGLLNYWKGIKNENK